MRAVRDGLAAGRELAAAQYCRLVEAAGMHWQRPCCSPQTWLARV